MKYSFREVVAIFLTWEKAYHHDKLFFLFMISFSLFFKGGVKAPIKSKNEKI